MENAFGDFNGLEIFFLIAAVIGGSLVLVQLVLQFFGGDADTGAEAGAAMGTDMGADMAADVGPGVDLDIDIDSRHIDADAGFKVLSLHSLSSFLMMFGLVGLALYRQSRAGSFIALLGAVAAGSAAVWVIGRLFRGAGRLQSSGTLETRHAVGSTGTVYLNIPPGRTGRVSVSFRNRLREFDAITADGVALASGTPVRVTGVRANILIVEKIH